MLKLLSIAGSDPTSGAGIQADLKVFKSLGAYGLSVITALTAQNTSTVREVFALPAHFVTKQIDTLLADIRPDATKIGMLYSESIMQAIASCLHEYKLKNVVLDPIVISSSGKPLLTNAGLKYLKQEFLRFVHVITPNYTEACMLCGDQAQLAKDLSYLAKSLYSMCGRNIIITGGDTHKDKTTLAVYDGEHFELIKGKKHQGTFHGTGCAFSSALTYYIASGKDLFTSAMLADKFVKKAISKSLKLGKEMRLLHV